MHTDAFGSGLGRLNIYSTRTHSWVFETLGSREKSKHSSDGHQGQAELERNSRGCERAGDDDGASVTKVRSTRVLGARVSHCPLYPQTLEDTREEIRAPPLGIDEQDLSTQGTEN